MTSGTTDRNGDGVPDACQLCLADLDADRLVGGPDLGALLAGWGADSSADLDGSGTVDGADLGLLPASWGSCS